jgi:hypothetical protein
MVAAVHKFAPARLLDSNNPTYIYNGVDHVIFEIANGESCNVTVRIFRNGDGGRVDVWDRDSTKQENHFGVS